MHRDLCNCSTKLLTEALRVRWQMSLGDPGGFAAVTADYRSQISADSMSAGLNRQRMGRHRAIVCDQGPAPAPDGSVSTSLDRGRFGGIHARYLIATRTRRSARYPPTE